MTTTTQIRDVTITWESCGPHWHELPAIADQVSAGIHRRTQSGETDEQFLDRVAAEIAAEFATQAGGATGADGFAFSAHLVFANSLAD